jgi:hypothetical protein
MEIYSQILDNGGPAFGTLFRHVRDRPTEGFLFHCTGPLCHTIPHTSYSEQT